MGDEIIDLNVPPEDGLVQYVKLQKDHKTICRTKCCNLPFAAPAHWIISEFRPSSLYWQLDLPQCQLYPYHENSYQKNEWSIFLHFLWKNKTVAVVKSECCNFYLLAPDECPEFTHIVVQYKMTKAPLSSDYRGIGKSVGRSSQDLNQNSGKNGRHCKTDRVPLSSMNDVIHEKSFVRTDPSYLRTLSQAHAGWAFGAIAELVDNSRDANSTRLGISVEYLYYKREGQKIPVLSVVDDGDGMSHADIVRMLSFGHKQPDEEDTNRIGRFGIGFKTGAMKLGRDVLVLTQTSCSRSVAFLSQSYNEHKENLEIPIITYHKNGQFMEIDHSIQSKACADLNLNAIKEFSPFNEYLIGERLGLFGSMDTGTQIYIWNLDKWGSDYSLEWVDEEEGQEAIAGALYQKQGDILIRSRRMRTRPGQISKEVPLDYSLQSYLEVIFLDPRMKIVVQGSLVKSRPLAKSLSRTVVVEGTIMDKAIHLTIGRSQVEWERMNCGIFLYWHGRLVEAYKRVGGMVHNADIGRGVLGVMDVSTIMDDGNGHAWVLNNKQGFQDCEAYAKLEEWLGCKVDEYWDEYFDVLDVEKGDEGYKPDHEWVQCDKCRKWRILSTGFDSDSLPAEWFCYMPPFNGKCEAPEQQPAQGVITVAAKRSRYESEQSLIQNKRSSKTAKKISPAENGRRKHSSSISSPKVEHACEADSGEDSTQTEDDNSHSKARRRRGPPRNCKH